MPNPGVLADRSPVPQPARPVRHAVQARRIAYRQWRDQRTEQGGRTTRWIDQHPHRSGEQNLDYGLEL